MNRSVYNFKITETNIFSPFLSQSLKNHEWKIYSRLQRDMYQERLRDLFKTKTQKAATCVCIFSEPEKVIDRQTQRNALPAIQMLQ